MELIQEMKKGKLPEGDHPFYFENDRSKVQGWISWKELQSALIMEEIIEKKISELLWKQSHPTHEQKT